MASPKISTFREIVPLIYSWTTPDIPKYDGWEKIGYTEQESADARIAQQAIQLSVKKEKLWSRRALFTTEAGGRFSDTDFHAYLKQQGVEREASPSAPSGTTSRPHRRRRWSTSMTSPARTSPTSKAAAGRTTTSCAPSSRPP